MSIVINFSLFAGIFLTDVYELSFESFQLTTLTRNLLLFLQFLHEQHSSTSRSTIITLDLTNPTKKKKIKV